MITHEWRRAQHHATVRRAASILFLACLLLAVILGALALASSPARSAPAAEPLSQESRANLSRELKVCAAIEGLAREHCQRTVRTAAAPRAANQEHHTAVWAVAPAATALLALIAVRRVGRREPS